MYKFHLNNKAKANVKIFSSGMNQALYLWYLIDYLIR